MQPAAAIHLVVKDKISFDHVPLNKPLEANYLNRYSADELERLRKNLVTRAAKIVGDIAALKAKDDYDAKQFSRQMYNTEIRENDDPSGKILFKYSCEPRFADHNFFIPGFWFEALELELADLQERKAQNIETFPERKKRELVSLLTGGAM